MALTKKEDNKSLTLLVLLFIVGVVVGYSFSSGDVTGEAKLVERWTKDIKECDDGIDNDNDGNVDYPMDPGCQGYWDNTEYSAPRDRECSDGWDNDDDGLIDYPADPQCSSVSDDSEEFLV